MERRRISPRMKPVISYRAWRAIVVLLLIEGLIAFLIY